MLAGVGARQRALAMSVLRYVGIAIAVAVLHLTTATGLAALAFVYHTSQTGRVASLLFEVLLFPLCHPRIESDGPPGDEDAMLLNSACWGIAFALVHAAFSAIASRSAKNPSLSTR